MTATGSIAPAMPSWFAAAHTRNLASLVLHRLYRLQAHGSFHVGTEGPLVLVVPSRSPLAGLMVQAVAPRPVHVVAQAEPDGHTLLLAFDGTLAINPHMYSKLPFDPIADFAPVGKIGDVPLLVITNPALPARTFAELVALSNARPGGIAYGTAGTGSTQHIMFELLKQRAGANFVHAPYKGAAPAMVDVMGGHLPMVGAALAGSLDNIRAGKLRALAISTAQRSKFVPEVPTLVESGFPDMVITGWHGIAVPAKTPRAIVERLNRELNSALAEPAVVERLDVIGSIAAPGTPEQFAANLKRDLDRYREVIKAIGIKAE